MLFGALALSLAHQVLISTPMFRRRGIRR